MIRDLPQDTETLQAIDSEVDMRRLMIMTFTDKGYELANRICDDYKAGRLMSDAEACELAEVSALRVTSGSLHKLTENAWNDGYDLLYISAVGIAVRAIAGLIDSKLNDRAVIVMDEAGRHIIPVLSGHVGGADALAKIIAGYTGGEVIVTSTSDVRNKPAFDEWASANNFAILNKEMIAPLYDKLLSDKTVTALCVDYEGELPFEKCMRLTVKGAPCAENVRGELSDRSSESASIVNEAVDVIIYGGYDTDVINVLTHKCADKTLVMVRRNYTVGLGCKRGKTAPKIQECINDACKNAGLDIRLIGELATIDIKADEEGIKSVCANNRWKLSAYTADKLREVPGDYASSEFVEKTVGVDNVCERAAVISGGRLIVNKSVYEGVTVAIAVNEQL